MGAGEAGLAAIGRPYPFTFFATAAGAGIGIGGGVSSFHKQGEEQDTARREDTHLYGDVDDPCSLFWSPFPSAFHLPKLIGLLMSRQNFHI